jgi:hypothetical protein
MKLIGKLKQKSPEKTAKNGRKFVTLTVDNSFFFCWNIKDIDGLKEGDECEIEYKQSGNFKILQKISWKGYKPKAIPNKEVILKFMEQERSYEELKSFVNDESIIDELVRQGDIIQISPDKFVLLR